MRLLSGRASGNSGHKDPNGLLLFLHLPGLDSRAPPRTALGGGNRYRLAFVPNGIFPRDQCMTTRRELMPSKMSY